MSQKPSHINLADDPAENGSAQTKAPSEPPSDSKSKGSSPEGASPNGSSPEKKSEGKSQSEALPTEGSPTEPESTERSARTGPADTARPGPEKTGERYATSTDDILFGDPMQGVIRDPDGRVVYRIEQDRTDLDVYQLKDETGWEGEYVLKTRASGETQEISFTMPEVSATPTIEEKESSPETDDSEVRERLARIEEALSEQDAQQEPPAPNRAGRPSGAGSQRSDGPPAEGVRTEDGRTLREVQMELRRRKRIVRSQAQEIQSLEAEIDELRRKLGSARAERREAHADRDRMAEKKNDAQREQTRLEREVERLERERDRLDEENDKLREAGYEIRSGSEEAGDDHQEEPSMMESFFEHLMGEDGPLNQEAIQRLIQRWTQRQGRHQPSTVRAGALGAGNAGVNPQQANPGQGGSHQGGAHQGNAQQGGSQQGQASGPRANGHANSGHAGGAHSNGEASGETPAGGGSQTDTPPNETSQKVVQRDKAVEDLLSYMQGIARVEYLDDEQRINIDKARAAVEEKVAALRADGGSVKVSEWASLFESLVGIVEEAGAEPETFVDRMYPVFSVFSDDLDELRLLGPDMVTSSIANFSDGMSEAQQEILRSVVGRLFDRMQGTAERPGESENLPPGMNG
jgi:hypothetical protein